MKGIERQTLIIFSKTLYRGGFFQNTTGASTDKHDTQQDSNTPAIKAVQKPCIMFPMYFEETLVLIGQHSENISQIIDTFSVHSFLNHL